MIVYPIRSNLAKPGDAIPELFSKALAKNRMRVESKDIVAVSSKIVGIAENRIRYLVNIRPGPQARRLSRKHSISPSFAQAVLDEADNLVGGVKGALLTVNNGDAVANAGIDRKNAPEGAVVIWPRNADLSAVKIRQSIRRRSGKNVGVVIVDSHLRGGVDLFGRRIEITFRAIADGIAASAQLVMGEASDQIPFAIVRDAPVRLSNGHGIRSAKLAWNRCLYMSQIPRAND